MQQNYWYLIFAIALLEAFVLSLFMTYGVRRLAIKLDIVDRPGERKMQKVPVPLLGGISIYLSFNLVILANLTALVLARQLDDGWLNQNVLAFLGDSTIQPLIGIFAGGFLIFLLGIVDDIKALSPEIKLSGQIVAALVLVLSGVRLDFFIGDLLNAIPLTASMSEEWRAILQYAVSGTASIFWVVMMTNSMNFLDNMDGLCGGIAIIAALSFFLCVLPQQEYFVCAMLMVFAGAVAGFLYHNLSPASIYMGDAGAMFCGYILATVAVLGTFYSAKGASPITVAAPLLALCVPIFDTVSVVYIRWRKGESIMKGDKRHFSHRLVEMGMSPRHAVDFIFLVAGVIGLGGALLSQVTALGTMIILGQTAGVFLLIVLLMNVRRSANTDRA